MDSRELVKGIINKNFPELKRKIIFVSDGRVFNLRFSAMVSYFILFSWIAFHPKSRNYSKQSLEALTVHELSHLSIIVNMNLFKKIKFAFNWLFAKKGKANFEREADILTVKKGYGKSLLKLIEEAEKTYTKEEWKKKRKGYLNSREIKKYMKEFGKK